MGVSEGFSAKRWAEDIIAMAEGRKTSAVSKVGVHQTAVTMKSPSMKIDEGFSTKDWTMMMLSKASNQAQA